MLSKCLMKQFNMDYRDKMGEMVKDYPAMRDEFGGKTFDKKIGNQLLSTLAECRAELNAEAHDEYQEN